MRAHALQIAAVVASACCFAGNAAAFEFMKSPKGAVASRLERTVVFRFPAEVPATLDRRAVRDVVERVLADWSQASGLVLKLEDGPPDPPTGCSGSGLDVNDIVFVNREWTRRPDAIAETPVCMGQDSGRIYGADILLNAAEHSFAVLPDDHKKGGVAYDLESVLSHEMGHALGMDHSLVREAVMWGGGERGDVSRRRLAEDDVVGIQSLYSAQEPSAVGCSVAPGRSSLAGVAGLLLLVPVIHGRRRSTTRRVREPQRLTAPPDHLADQGADDETDDG